MGRIRAVVVVENSDQTGNDPSLLQRTVTVRIARKIQDGCQQDLHRRFEMLLLGRVQGPYQRLQNLLFRQFSLNQRVGTLSKYSHETGRLQAKVCILCAVGLFRYPVHARHQLLKNTLMTHLPREERPVGLHEDCAESLDRNSRHLKRRRRAQDCLEQADETRRHPAGAQHLHCGLVLGHPAKEPCGREPHRHRVARCTQWNDDWNEPGHAEMLGDATSIWHGQSRILSALGPVEALRTQVVDRILPLMVRNEAVQQGEHGLKQALALGIFKVVQQWQQPWLNEKIRLLLRLRSKDLAQVATGAHSHVHVLVQKALRHLAHTVPLFPLPFLPLLFNFSHRVVLDI
mmetsp:Transcript_6297/g.19011  ORF Transcript_6297/g.19011 Transcript_6297/m.19011 type:complete len:345 (-) Transcript_6297:1400-2434(-)